jgi:hypothetical protein
VLNRVTLNPVLVRTSSDENTVQIRETAQASGEIWFGPTIWQGRPAFQLSVQSWRTSTVGIHRVIRLLPALKA